VSSETGISPQEVGEALLAGERVYGGLPFDQRLKTEESIAARAAGEARMKEGTSFKEAFEVMAGLPHMIGEYRPEQQDEALRAFSYASLITPSTISQFANSLSYSMPILNAAGITDPDTVMFMSAMMQTAGIRNTKSGTWLRSFYEGLQTRGTGDPRDNKHDAYLRDMGLVDDKGKPLWQVNNPDGSPDQMATLMKIAGIINTYEHTEKDPAKRLATVHGAFGERGGGVASMLALDQWIDQFPVIAEKMKTFKGGDDFLKFMSENSPVFAADKAFADLQIVLMDIGKNALPPLVLALQGLDAVFKDMDGVISKWPFLANFTNGPGLAVNAYNAAGDIAGGISSWWNGSGGGSPSYSSGAIAPRGVMGSVGRSSLTSVSGESNRGVGGWWTQERMQHAADRLVAEAGLSQMGAAALVARWAGVEASGGPTSSNNIGGGHWGIAQWDSARGGPAMASASFDDQISHAVSELNGSEKAAGDALRSATTLAQGAIGASRYERAEHFNQATGIDDSTASTPVGSVYRKLYGGTADKAASSPPVSDADKAASPPPVSKASPWAKSGGDDTVFDSDSTDPSQKAHAKEHVTNVTINLDGKKIAQSVTRRQVRNNMYVYGPSSFDGSALPSGVDHGMASAVSA
jgi:hypothetical protein